MKTKDVRTEWPKPWSARVLTRLLSYGSTRKLGRDQPQLSRAGNEAVSPSLQDMKRNKEYRLE